MFSVRLIRGVEKDPVFQRARPQKGGQFREERPQKFFVFRGIRRYIPTEYPFFSAIGECDDFRGEFCAPLSEKVRYFKVGYPAFFRQIDPFGKK